MSSKLLIKPTANQGKMIGITPQTAGWRYVGFDLYLLKQGGTAEEQTGKREICLVIISGKGRVFVDGRDLGHVGERLSPFEGKPWSVYVPAKSAWQIVAETNLTLAVCSAPADVTARHPRVIAPADLSVETRGTGSNTRFVTNILPENDPTAASLLVVEVITPNGHTSSYPPHKHDQDNLPHESYLEEIYYHRLNPPQGFAFQRVYTDADPSGKREIDDAMAVEDGDVVLVPKGYHPCATCHGYDLYYLNVMAGPKRTWKFHNAQEHEWLLPRA
jgi:5-deoxy-glucuronate isomerase